MNTKLNKAFSEMRLTDETESNFNKDLHDTIYSQSSSDADHISAHQKLNNAFADIAKADKNEVGDFPMLEIRRKEKEAKISIKARDRLQSELNRMASLHETYDTMPNIKHQGTYNLQEQNLDVANILQNKIGLPSNPVKSKFYKDKSYDGKPETHITVDLESHSSGQSKIERVHKLKQLLLNTITIINIAGSALYIYFHHYFQHLTRQNFGQVVNEVLRKLGVQVSMLQNEYMELMEQLQMEPDLLKDPDECKTDESKIAFSNGTYDAPSGEITDYSIYDYQFTLIDFRLNLYDESPNSDVTRNYISSICDYDSVKELYFWELIGYILSNYNRKIIVVFIGPANSGKTSLANFIRCIVGTDMCVSMGVKELSYNFNMAELDGKKICIDSEMESTPLTSRDIRIIKQIGGNDLVQGNRKYERQFYFVPTAKLVWFSNNFITVEHTGEDMRPFYNRLKVFKLNNSIPYKKQIGNLDKFLYQDRGYFLSQAMKGLTRLVNNGFQFTEPEYAEDYVNYTSPNSEYADVRNFIGSIFTLSSDAVTPVQTLYSAYETAALEEGQTPLSKKLFTQMLVNNYGIERSRKRDVRNLVGIRLNEE